MARAISPRANRDVVLLGHDLLPLLGGEAAAGDDARLSPPGRRVDLPAERVPVVGEDEQPTAVRGKARREPGIGPTRHRERADRLLRLDVPQRDLAFSVRPGERTTVGGEGHREDLPAAWRQRRPDPRPAVGLPKQDLAVDLSTGEQATVRGERDGSDLVVGVQRGDAAPVPTSRTSMPSRVACAAPNGIASCEPSGLNASPSTKLGSAAADRSAFVRRGPRCARRRPPRPRRAALPARYASAWTLVGVGGRRATRRELEAGRSVVAPGRPRGRRHRSSADRQPTAIGREFDREDRPARRRPRSGRPAQRLGVDQSHPAVQTPRPRACARRG